MDKRFDKLKSAKYKAVKKNQQIELDNRFGCFKKDEAYTKNPADDKYGSERYKPNINDFDEFYKLEGQSEGEQESASEILPKDQTSSEEEEKVCQNKVSDESEISDVESETARVVEDDESITSDTSSSSDEEEESDSSLISEEEEVDDSEVIPTSRLALTKIDWEHINAQDIYMLASSFLPEGGQLKSVKVYPSEFGLQEMKKEREEGPKEFLEISQDEDPATKKRKLIEYQKKRLKYYYAIIECDNPKTAQHLDKELDGLQFMENILPLKFKYVPEEMTFDHAPPSSEAYSQSKNYEPVKNLDQNVFQSTTFEPTWDNNDPHREQFIQKAFQNPETIEEQDLKQYLASASESSEDEAEALKKVQLMKELLNTEGKTVFKSSKSTVPKTIKKKNENKVENIESDDNMSMRESSINASNDDSDDDFFEKEEEPVMKTKEPKKLNSKKRKLTVKDDESLNSDSDIESLETTKKPRDTGIKKIKLTANKESAKERKLKKKLEAKKHVESSAETVPLKTKFSSSFKAMRF